MLEHSDGDDAVVGALRDEVTVVLQFETRMFGHAPGTCASAGNLELLLAERNARNIRIGRLCKIERHAAPAGADLQHAMTGFDEQLGCDMPLLGELGLIQGNARRIEIGAGILPVFVQEE